MSLTPYERGQLDGFTRALRIVQMWGADTEHAEDSIKDKIEELERLA